MGHYLADRSLYGVCSFVAEKGVSQANIHTKKQGKNGEHCEQIQEENKFKQKCRRPLSSEDGGELSGRSEGSMSKGPAAGRS